MSGGSNEKGNIVEFPREDRVEKGEEREQEGEKREGGGET